MRILLSQIYIIIYIDNNSLQQNVAVVPDIDNVEENEDEYLENYEFIVANFEEIVANIEEIIAEVDLIINRSEDQVVPDIIDVAMENEADNKHDGFDD